MSKILNGNSRINYRVKMYEDEYTNTKHYAEYTCVCPKCGRYANINVTTHVNLLSCMETANMDMCIPTGKTPEVYIVPTDGVSVQCPCGCGMIPVDTISAKIAFAFMKNFGFENLILPDPINETGLSFNPSGISFMDPMDSERMKSLISAIVALETNIDCSKRFSHIIVRAVNDDLGWSIPIRNENEYKELVEIPDTYISIECLSTSDTIRIKSINSSNEFSSYLFSIYHLMNGKNIKDVIEKLNCWRGFSSFDWDGDINPNFKAF